jgi:GDP-L-fucose synthase
MEDGVPLFAPRRVAVLGGTGLIGRHVLGALSKLRSVEIVASHHRRAPFPLEDCTWRRGDLIDQADMRAVVEGADTIISCAGRVSTTAELRRDPTSSVLETLRIGVNALEAAAVLGIRRFVLIGSCTGYPGDGRLKQEPDMFLGDPPDGWFGVGWMHRYLEKQLEWYTVGLRRIASAVVLRPTMVYGPHDDFEPASGHFIPSMISQVVRRQKPIEIWGDGTQTRNALHAKDVASAIVASLGAGAGYHAYNVASAQSVSVNEVLRTLVEVDGFSDAQIVHRLDKVGGVSAMEVSAEAFVQCFGWRPEVSLREGLAGTVQWYRAHLANAA